MIQTLRIGSVISQVVRAPAGNTPTTPGANSMMAPSESVMRPRPAITTNTSAISVAVEVPTECSHTPTSR